VDYFFNSQWKLFESFL